MRTRTEFVEDLSMMLGGYAAENLFFGDLTTGASSDMKQATHLARNMLTQWGMSDVLGPRTYGEREEMIFLGRNITENRDYSESRAELIDKEMDRLIGNALETAVKLISAHRDAMDRIAEHLVEHETIERDEFADIVGLAPANVKNKRVALAVDKK